MKHYTHIIDAIWQLFFPTVCTSCGNHLIKDEVEICRMCIRRLPRTGFEYHPTDNLVFDIFAGRCRIVKAYSMYYYRKGERVQHLLHQIKYHGQTALAKEMGEQLGKLIKRKDQETFDYLLPIPLHPLKQRKRGYNQAEIIAIGIQKQLDIAIDTENIYRNTNTSTQTRKGRYARWENVEHIFSIHQPKLFENKHILVIDDVITTGATMEAFINQLRKINGCEVSVASLACAAI